jgi:hypothetical protein
MEFFMSVRSTLRLFLPFVLSIGSISCGKNSSPPSTSATQLEPISSVSTSTPDAETSTTPTKKFTCVAQKLDRGSFKPVLQVKLGLQKNQCQDGPCLSMAAFMGKMDSIHFQVQFSERGMHVQVGNSSSIISSTDIAAPVYPGRVTEGLYLAEGDYYKLSCK